MIYNLLAEEGANNTGTIIIMIVLIVAIIGLFIWQSITGKKRQQEAQNMVNSLKVGDGVKTIGGICGVVAEINNQENTFVLETGTDANKSFIKFDKGAIYQTYSKMSPEEAAAQQAQAQAPAAEPVKEEAPVEEQPKAKKAKANDKTEEKSEAPAEPATEEKVEENN